MCLLGSKENVSARDDAALICLRVDIFTQAGAVLETNNNAGLVRGCEEGAIETDTGLFPIHSCKSSSLGTYCVPK